MIRPLAMSCPGVCPSFRVVGGQQGDDGVQKDKAEQRGEDPFHHSALRKQADDETARADEQPVVITDSTASEIFDPATIITRRR